MSLWPNHHEEKRSYFSYAIVFSSGWFRVMYTKLDWIENNQLDLLYIQRIKMPVMALKRSGGRPPCKYKTAVSIMIDRNNMKLPLWDMFFSAVLSRFILLVVHCQQLRQNFVGFPYDWSGKILQRHSFWTLAWNKKFELTLTFGFWNKILRGGGWTYAEM